MQIHALSKPLLARFSGLLGLLALSALAAACTGNDVDGSDVGTVSGPINVHPEESDCGGGDPGECASFKGTGCYWMENTSGNYCWVPADWASSFEDCFAMDSCDGGLGASGGGCYKWADSSGGERAPW